jgi:hypothetical protein
LSYRIVIAWTLIDVLRRFGSLLDWLEVQHWHWTSEFHHIWFHNAKLFRVPFSTFNEEIRDEGSVFWMFVYLLWFLWYWNKVEFKLIDWCSTSLSTESLQKRSGETIWICEASDPESEWNTFIRPDSKEFISVTKVCEPVSKWLDGEVSEAPCFRNLVVIKSIQNFFEVW